MAKKKTKGTSDMMACPDCGKEVAVGFGGASNLEKHREGGRCHNAQRKLEESKELGRSQALMKGFLVPKKKPAPSTVSAPAVIAQATTPACISAIASLEQISYQSEHAAVTANIKTTKHPAINRLRDAVSKLPGTIPTAAPDGPLASFSVPPHVDEGESAWEKYDGPLNTLLQSSPDALSNLVQIGEWGLTGLVNFFDALVVNHGVDECLLEGKIERLIQAINIAIYKHTPVSSTLERDGIELVVREENSALDVDITRSSTVDTQVPQHKSVSLKSLNVTLICEGLEIDIPSDLSAHTAYPSELHIRLGDPWNYGFMEGKLILWSRTCERLMPVKGTCVPCSLLRENTNLEGILQRMKDGVHENAAYMYHSHHGLTTMLRKKAREVRELRLGRLNDAHLIAVKARQLGVFELFVMAVGSGKVERVDRLVRIKIARGYGMQGLLKLYYHAAQKIYSPKNYTEEDALRGLLFWKLGGARIAGIAHRSLGLPSLSYLRARTTVPPLIVSSSYPTVQEVATNVRACFDPIQEVMEKCQVLFQVLMLDELKVEERPRWSDQTNNIVGLCREHGQSTSLQLCTEKEVDLLIDALEKKEVHTAVEATVGALGVISDETRVYGARPILVSGSCKSEKGAQHAKLIKATYEGAKDTKLRTICIASDGESRRGDALVRLTMKENLSPSSTIYPLLSILTLLNLLVGEDDVTADKDYKHIIKRLRNLLLRQKGSFIHGIHITPAVIKAHLLHYGISPERVKYLMDPSDKQDVKLAFDLLHAIWTLPTISAEDHSISPTFRDTRAALKTFGALFQHILMPYICVDLSLSEQLMHLSAAAHLLMVLVVETGSVINVMPTQLYIDIMIMIKNAYFCIAKAKVDAPDSKFWLILLGTDRLEVLFGILRTMVGGDANVDVYQLALRLTGTTEVSSILATHPEWDRAPRRLKLPTLAKDSLEIHNSVDYINPASWRGDVYVHNVNLQTCWKLGKQTVESRFAKAAGILRSICNGSNDMFSPLGVSLVHTQRHDDELDDTYEKDISTQTRQLAMGHEVEDQAAVEEPSGSFSPYLDIDGSRISKAKYLNRAYEMFKKPGSRDRLKRVADGQRYHNNLWENNSYSRSNYLAVDLLEMDVPIVAVLQCDEQLFACIGEVKSISYNSECLEEVPLDLLKEQTLLITFQILNLAPAFLDDNGDGRMDWRWTKVRGKSYTVPGVAVLPINPELSVAGNSPYYLFESKSIMGIALRILENLTIYKEARLKIPTVPISNDFPYRESSGKACFLCEHEDERRLEHIPGQCAQCTPAVLLPHSPHGVLAHNAAHILYDPKLERSLQLCGLCLRPAPVCTFYLKKSRGVCVNLAVDYSKTSCANPLEFRYTKAEHSKENSPSSNVPLACPECPRNAPAIWRYNLRQHLIEKHPTIRPDEHKDKWGIAEVEKTLLRRVWNARHETKQQRRSKKSKKRTLQISEAHSTCSVLQPNDLDQCEPHSQTNIFSENFIDKAPGNSAIEGPSNPDDPIPSDEWDTSENEKSEIGDSDAESDSGDDTTYEPERELIDLEEGMDAVEMAMDQNIMDLTERMTNDPQSHCTSSLSATFEPPAHTTKTSEEIDENDPNIESDANIALDSNPIQEQETGPAVRRSVRKRKHRDFRDSLEVCTCGLKISPPADGVIKCSYKGCETQWYHLDCMGLEYAIQDWYCEACVGSAENNSMAVKRSRV